MDPVSHAALGRTLAALVTRGAPVRGVAAAAVFGALAPDLDAVVMPFGWDRYLLVHEIGTHAAIGTLACAALVATIARARVREAAWRTLFLSAWLGAASHVLLDLLSSARIRVFWPFAQRQVSLPLVAMADPWLGGLLAAALPLLWLARTRRRQVAAAVLGIAAAFLAVKAVLAVQAVSGYRAHLGSSRPPSDYNVQARWASLLEWEIFDRDARGVRAWRARAGGGPPTLLRDWPAAGESGLVATSRTLPAVRNFLRAHDITFAVTQPAGGGGHLVLWSDMRFCRSAAASPAGTEPHVIPGARGMACALWVGGELDAGGRPIRQIVRIFGFTQTRAPPG
jgi:membrane-bound metal-dependent hydrolase YbcI (DUF457 family)